MYCEKGSIVLSSGLTIFQLYNSILKQVYQPPPDTTIHILADNTSLLRGLGHRHSSPHQTPGQCMQPEHELMQAT
jgi:hypothetical protein